MLLLFHDIKKWIDWVTVSPFFLIIVSRPALIDKKILFTYHRDIRCLDEEQNMTKPRILLLGICLSAAILVGATELIKETAPTKPQSQQEQVEADVLDREVGDTNHTISTKPVIKVDRDSKVSGASDVMNRAVSDSNYTISTEPVIKIEKKDKPAD